MTSARKQKVAIVCDWLTNQGGAERVVYELHKMYPDAPIYTSSYNPKKLPQFKNADVRASFINKLPMSDKHQLWTVLRRFYFDRLTLKNYDLVISSSGAEAKAVRVPNGIHVNYCHSPTHYYWVKPKEYQLAKNSLNPIYRFGLKVLTPWMKRWDYKAAQRPDYIIANSNTTKERIAKFYKRKSTVVHPPVDIDRFKNFNFANREGYVTVSRQTHYKRVDLVVKAFNKLDLPLKVIGSGPEHEALKKLATSKKITFHTNKNDKEVAVDLASSKAFLFASIEDFGIVTTEAIAAGTPAIVYKEGGSLDIVKDGVNGLFFDKQHENSIIKTVKKFEKTKFDHTKIKQSAAKFSTPNFHKKMKLYIAKATEIAANKN